MIESERLADTLISHEDEGERIGEAELLVREALKLRERVDLLIFRRSQDMQGTRGEDGTSPLSRECVSRPPPEEGDRLIEDVDACNYREVISLEA